MKPRLVQTFDDASAPNNGVVPHSLDAERSVLGAILLHNEAFSVATRVVAPDHFFRDAHRRIFEAMRKLVERAIAIDLVTLKHELERSHDLDAVGGPAYIASLVDGVPHSMNVGHYAAIVKESAGLRSVITCANTMLANAYDAGASADTVLDRAQQTLQSVQATTVMTGGLSRSLATLLDSFASVPLRQPRLGELLALGEIAMLHGQPRDGKTWAALEMAVAFAVGDAAFGLPHLTANHSGAVLIVSNEDSERAFVNRLQLVLAGRGVTHAPIHLLVGQGCDLDAAIWKQHLTQEVRRLGAELVILDPLRSLTACVDQGPHELQPFALFLRRFLRETGVALLLVHHDSKPPAGVTDTRRRAQRASGGAIFSIVDAPMHVERVDDRRSLIVPDGFKFCPDPESFVVERVAAGTAIRLTACSAGTATDANQLALQTKVETFVRENPGRSIRDIAKAVKAHRQAVADTLERMQQAGRVAFVNGPRKAKLWTLR